MRTKQTNLKSLCTIVIKKWTFKNILSKSRFLTYYFDISFILACNSISLMSFNSVQSRLLFDVLYFEMDQAAMKLSTKM